MFAEEFALLLDNRPRFDQWQSKPGEWHSRMSPVLIAYLLHSTLNIALLGMKLQVSCEGNRGVGVPKSERTTR